MMLLHCKDLKFDSGAHVSLKQLTTRQAQRQLKAAIQHQICVKGSLRNTSSDLSVLPGQAADNLANLIMSASRQVS